MSTEEAVIESQDELQQQTETGSSDDLRSALESATREVNERIRDEAGRFAKREESPAQSQQAQQPQEVDPAAQQQATPQAQQAQQAQQHAQTQQQQQQQAAPLRAPDAWSPAAKAQFAALPPEVQQEIARREAEVHKGFTTQDEHRQLGKSFETAVQPYLAMIRAEGSDPVRAAQHLMQTAYTLRAGDPGQKAAMVVGLMQQYGIDPNHVFQRLTGGQQQAQVDPQVANLQQQVQQLQQVLTESRRTAEQQTEAQISQEIERFASDPKNLYFANVRSQMASLMNAGQAKDLQEAYDMACWAHPQIRPLLLQQQQRAAEQQARTAKARAAGQTLTGAPAGQVAAAPAAGANRSLRDELTANFRAAMNRDA